MKGFRKHTLCVTAILFTALFIGQFGSAEEELLTVAESSDFTATSTYDDVMGFIQSLQVMTPHLRVETLCMSTEHRAVPLLVLGNPLPSSPSELRGDERTVIYIQANIHAGEVEGKEASLMLARDICLQPKPPYLDKLIILIAPIFNADGNEKISPENRQNQVGPEKGVGVRYNGQNLDLNRDGIKMESPEVQGLTRNVLNRWDPALVIDCHTTNGSYHKEPVTYLWSLNPNGDTAIIGFMRDTMLPRVSRHLRDHHKTLSIPYGNFMDFKNPEKGWRPAGPQAMYLTNYIGLRNRMAILLENYAYAPYKTRVFGNYHFLMSVLDVCHSQSQDIQRLVQEADKGTIQMGMDPFSADGFAFTYDLKPLKNPITIQGWEMEVIPQEGRPWPKIKKTDKVKKYTLPYYCDFIPKKTIAYPHAYLMAKSDPAIITKLQQHGITVEKLTTAVRLEVESFLIHNIKGADRIYQGHRKNSVSGEYQTANMDFPAGTIVVSTAQPLGRLVSYMLEAECDDGLLAWNFFDRFIVPQWGDRSQVYPVYRLLKPRKLAKIALPRTAQ